MSLLSGSVATKVDTSDWFVFAELTTGLPSSIMISTQPLLLLGIISYFIHCSSATAANPTLPVVDLGYELHQATFNVSDFTCS
jgi:hypothetical protein